MQVFARSIAAATLLLAACTDRRPGDTEESASATSSTSGLTSSGSSASASESTSTGTGSPTTGSTSASTTGPTGGSCPNLVGDVEGSPAVEVQIVNARDRDVFLVDACAGSYLAIEGGGGTWPVPACETCVSALANDCGCPKFCVMKTLRIVPGGRFAASWNGIAFAKQAIPAGCAPACTSACMLGAQAPEASYMVGVRELTTEVCESEGCGTCTPNGEGWCETDSVSEHLGTLAGKNFAYPSETAVELVFE